MTKREFEEEVLDFGDLVRFCSENGLYCMDDVLDGESLSEWIWEEIRDFTGSWEDLRDRLSDIEPGFDWYYREGYLEFTPLDEYDFDRYKSDVMDSADYAGVWDEEAEDEGEEEAEEQAEMDEETRRRLGGYYFTDPLTGEVLVSGYSYAPVSPGELDSLFS